MAEQRGFLRFVLGAFRSIDLARRIILDIAFLAIIVVILLLIFKPSRVNVPKAAALYINPQGTLVEQIPNRVRRAQQRLLGATPPPVTRVRDLVNALGTAKNDPRIQAVVLNLNYFSGGQLAELQRVGRALKQFETSGKKVIAYAANYTQGSYYLAAMSSQAYLTTHQGIVALLGLAAYRNYYKELLKKLRVQWHVVRVGKYKSYVEPYMRNDMSKAARHENIVVLNSLWHLYLTQIARARKLHVADLVSLVNHLPQALQAANGDAARVAKTAGLINGVLDMPRIRAKIAGLVGHNGSVPWGYSRIGLERYLAARRPSVSLADRYWDQVGVIVAQGDIVGGNAPQGTVGAKTLSSLLHRAANNPRVKALVLDVDSPGGSALAADQILHAELAFKAAGKPLVVSMSGLAASGGYWISMAADKIYASKASITGSIGIFAMFPTFQNTLHWIGVHRDGVETAPLADFGDPLRALSPEGKSVLDLIIKHGYAEFTGKVSKYRNLPLSHVDAIAQGRVWTGEDALRVGLVDHIGTLQNAIKEAAKLARVKNYGVVYLSPKLTSGEQFLLSISRTSMARDFVGHWFEGRSVASTIIESPLFSGFRRLLAIHNSQGVYAYCFCAPLSRVE